MNAAMEVSQLQGALDEERNKSATLQAEKEALAQEAGAQASEIDILKEEKRWQDAYKDCKKTLKEARKEISNLRHSLDNFEESEAGKSLSVNACLVGLEILKVKLEKDHPDLTWDFTEMAEYVIGEMDTPREAGRAPKPPTVDEPPSDSAPASPFPKAPSAGDANSGAE
ncbi:unnamed protein product [Linum trigynum]|uniref:Uncharacterized protein n=1 Tax=Linum trigynum TaxID=586398 RepID=A0AAV2F526_9ROSI